MKLPTPSAPRGGSSRVASTGISSAMVPKAFVQSSAPPKPVAPPAPHAPAPVSHASTGITTGNSTPKVFVQSNAPPATHTASVPRGNVPSGHSSTGAHGSLGLGTAPLAAHLAQAINVKAPDLLVTPQGQPVPDPNAYADTGTGASGGGYADAPSDASQDATQDQGSGDYPADIQPVYDDSTYQEQPQTEDEANADIYADEQAADAVEDDRSNQLDNLEADLEQESDAIENAPSPFEEVAALTNDDGTPYIPGMYTSEAEDEQDRQQAILDARPEITLDQIEAQRARDASMYGEGAPDALTRVSCYVKDAKLCCVGVVKTQYGPVPIASYVRVPKTVPDGPISFGTEGMQDYLLQAKEGLESTATIENMRHDCEGLVIRARQGDQNAIGTIRAVREAAKAGSPRARISHQLITSFITSHPVEEYATVSFEPFSAPDASMLRTAVRLANGPEITGERVQHMFTTFGGLSKRRHNILRHALTRFGADDELADIKTKLDALEAALVDIGRTIGMAIGLQNLRRDDAMIADYCPQAAWELGE